MEHAAGPVGHGADQDRLEAVADRERLPQQLEREDDAGERRVEGRRQAGRRPEAHRPLPKEHEPRPVPPQEHGHHRPDLHARPLAAQRHARSQAAEARHELHPQDPKGVGSGPPVRGASSTAAIPLPSASGATRRTERHRRPGQKPAGGDHRRRGQPRRAPRPARPARPASPPPDSSPRERPRRSHRQRRRSGSCRPGAAARRAMSMAASRECTGSPRKNAGLYDRRQLT